MKPEAFARLRELLLKAAELGEDDRRAFLEVECVKDPELRNEIESLLAHEGDSRPILETASGLPGDPSPAHRYMGVGREADPPRYIAGYRIIHKLGAGGMGEVFLAEQEQPLRRRVALKVIKLGMDTKEVMARFASERQALAILNHPNIANIFDAGTTESGRPYFVMELVAGDPITEHCERNHLDTRERLELFILVCQAIHHAHQKGIIHRDIKPSNVLVSVHDGRGVPKVIDFGVAKATNQRLTERTVYTEQGRLIGTPEYMSPEQADMREFDVDASTDIYSLGVLLYELLVGALPFHPQMLREAGFEGMRRIIREVDPPRPSTKVSSLDTSGGLTVSRGRRPSSLVRELRGDLDWITLKAMAKDRFRRYASAQDLSADVRRHLDGEKVLARPPSATHRLAKVLRRNRLRAVAIIATCAVLLASAAGVVYLLESLGRARQGKMVAVEVFEDRNARAISDNGDVLWARRLPGRIWPNGRWNMAQRPHTIFERDGRPIGVVLSLWPDAGPGSLWFLDAATGNVIWRREAAWGATPVNARGPMIYDWNVLVQWPSREDSVLVTGLLDGEFYGFCLQFLTLDNELLGTYYHPGPLSFCDQLDLGGNGPSILLYGGNSSARFVRQLVPFDTPMHPGCVVLLDPPAVDGQAFPYSRDLPEHRDWPDVPPATERSYVLVPPILPTQRAGIVGLNVSRNAQGRITIRAVVQDGRFVTFDADLRPLSVYLGVDSPADSLYKAGGRDFLPYLLIHDGKREFVRPRIDTD